MRKLILASCLAMGLTFGLAGLSTAKADHGFGGYRGAVCNPGFGGGGYAVGRGIGYGVGYGGGYGVGYAPYGRHYPAPVVAVPTFVPVGGFGLGRSSFYGGYPSAFGPGFGGGYGNLGYPNPYGVRTLPRTQLRIGF